VNPVKVGFVGELSASANIPTMVISSAVGVADNVKVSAPSPVLVVPDVTYPAIGVVASCPVKAKTCTS
jgi:hypothetical protein